MRTWLRPEALQARLQSRLRQPHPWCELPASPGRGTLPDHALPGDPLDLIPAAVLIPLILHPREVAVLLTRRAADLPRHPGQVSFPGGSRETEDDSPHDTALRECGEEIGLLREQVELAGYLGEYCTGTGFRITPVVGFVPPCLPLTLDEREVERTFEVPLAFFLDEANRRLRAWEQSGRRREFYQYQFGEFDVWGATAGMLVKLCEKLQNCA